MAVTLIATVGSSTANAFVTAVEATAYLGTRLNASAFTGASTDDQARAVIEATRELSVLSWEGQRADSTQALAWPRQFAVNPDSPWQYWFSTTELPQRVKDATCELALEFLKAGTTDIAALDPTISVIRKKVDVLETEYAAPFLRAKGLAIFPRVMALIRPLLTSSGVSVPLVRG
jgi:hypothetical protein